MAEKIPELPELPERIKKANSDDLMKNVDEAIAVQKKATEALRKRPINPKTYKGKVTKIDFTEEGK